MDLELDRIDADIYRSQTLWRPILARGVFGGQVISQALIAAHHSLDQPPPTAANADGNMAASHRVLHSLHAYFLLAGDAARPVVYVVKRIRDGATFATRIVTARQHGKVIFILTCSFLIPYDTPSSLSVRIDYQVPAPSGLLDGTLPRPESLPSYRDMTKAWLADARVPVRIRESLSERLAGETEPIPLDIRPVKTPTLADLLQPRSTLPAVQYLWVRVTHPITPPTSTATHIPSESLHRIILAYLTDHYLLSTTLLPHKISAVSHPVRLTMMASLDHSLWIHAASVRVDEWLLYEMTAEWTGDERGKVTGRVWRGSDGMLVATVAQEGVLRVGRAPALSKM